MLAGSGWVRVHANLVEKHIFSVTSACHSIILKVTFLINAMFGTNLLPKFGPNFRKSMNDGWRGEKEDRP